MIRNTYQVHDFPVGVISSSIAERGGLFSLNQLVAGRALILGHLRLNAVCRQ